MSRVHLLTILLLASLVGCGPRSPKKGTGPDDRGGNGVYQPAAPVNVDAAALWSAFGTDEAGATSQYLNKTLRVTAAIIGAPQDVEGRYFIVGRAPGGGSPAVLHFQVKTLSNPHMLALVNDNHKVITVNGVCRGKRADARPPSGYVVVLEDCVVESTAP